MKIILNGNAVEAAEHISLAQLLAQNGISTNGPVAVACNGQVVPKAKHAGKLLNDSDDILVFAATYGG